MYEGPHEWCHDEPHDWQKWANNSVFEYYSNSWGRILVFVFVFGWFFSNRIILYSYLVDFFKPNNKSIRIWLIFSNGVIFVFVFAHFWKVEYYLYSVLKTLFAHLCTQCILSLMRSHQNTHWRESKHFSFVIWIASGEKYLGDREKEW